MANKRVRIYFHRRGPAGTASLYLAVFKRKQAKKLLAAIRGLFADVYCVHPRLGPKAPSPSELVASAPDMLFVAIARNDEGLFQRLLVDGADVEMRDQRDRSVLFRAILDGRLTMVEQLIARGAKVDGTGNRAPLFAAVLRDRPAEAKLLLAAGADPRWHSASGNSALSIAKRKRIPALVAALEGKG